MQGDVCTIAARHSQSLFDLQLASGLPRTQQTPKDSLEVLATFSKKDLHITPVLKCQGPAHARDVHIDRCLRDRKLGRCGGVRRCIPAPT